MNCCGLRIACFSDQDVGERPAGRKSEGMVSWIKPFLWMRFFSMLSVITPRQFGTGQMMVRIVIIELQELIHNLTRQS
jgi:hypothetical protein